MGNMNGRADLALDDPRRFTYSVQWDFTESKWIAFCDCRAADLSSTTVHAYGDTPEQAIKKARRTALARFALIAGGTR
jgi:hypothetical protein